MEIKEVSNTIRPLLKNHGAEYVAIFGSLARGEASADSDIDILVRFHHDISLLDHIGVAQELEDRLGRRVDLITENSLSRYIAPSIKKDLKVVYGHVQRPDLL